MALSIAATYQARIFLLHVISNTVQRSLSDYSLDQSIVDRVMSMSIVFSNEKLKEAIDKVQENGNIKIIPDVRKGQPYEEILKEASEQKIDLIVIASHGETGFEEIFYRKCHGKGDERGEMPSAAHPKSGEMIGK